MVRGGFMYDSISVMELKRLQSQNSRLMVIDIRDKYQFLLEHIPLAVNIPMNFLLIQPEQYLDKNNTYYLYCEYGSRSKRVCEELSKLGYKVINIDGGYQAYKLG